MNAPDPTAQAAAQRAKEDRALTRLMEHLNAPTSFCEACAKGLPRDDVAHQHMHATREELAFRLVEAARPALNRLLGVKP